MNLAIPRKDEPELEQALSEAVEAEEVPLQWFLLVYHVYKPVGKYRVYKPQFIILISWFSNFTMVYGL